MVRKAVRAKTKIEITHPPKRIIYGEDGSISVYGPTAETVELLHHFGWAKVSEMATAIHSVAIFLNDQPVKFLNAERRDIRTARVVVLTFEALSVPDILTHCFDDRGMFIANPESTGCCYEGRHAECPGKVSANASTSVRYPCPCDCHGVIERLATLASERCRKGGRP